MINDVHFINFNFISKCNKYIQVVRNIPLTFFLPAQQGERESGVGEGGSAAPFGYAPGGEQFSISHKLKRLKSK